MIARPKRAGAGRAITLAAGVVCAGCRLARAQDYAGEVTAPPPPKTNVWATAAAASLTLTRGNSKTFLATMSLDTKAKWDHDEVALGVTGGFGESTADNVSSTTTEFVQGYAQFNHLFSERWYGGLRVDGQYDGIAGIDYRFKVSPVVGYYLIKAPRMKLALEGGPSLIMEHLTGQPADSYLAARLAEHFNYKLTPSTSLWESLEYLPKVSDWGENYLVNFEAGLETAITKHWTLRLVFQDMYANAPATDREPNDIRLLAGTGYKF